MGRPREKTHCEIHGLSLVKRPRFGSWICRECVRLKSKSWRDSNTERSKEYRDNTRGKKFGLSVGEYRTMSEEQGGLCAICRKPETRIVLGNLAALCVDHDHVTGKFRGLLCTRCNTGLGMFNDDATAMLNAVDYIRRIMNKK